jgi:diadenosine tetraphosphatase ApaH/serine/threonine PP2A family protein phosphatase
MALQSRMPAEKTGAKKTGDRGKRMLTAIFADIHGNREAFSACLAHARAAGAGRIVLLGDYVGYGADPEWCLNKVMDLTRDGAIAVKGNHDDAMDTPDPDMNPVAQAAIAWTRPLIDAAQREFLRGLPMQATEADRLFVHANSWAPTEWDYVRNEREAERCLNYARQRLIFVGHIHVPALYALAPGRGAQRFEPKAGSRIPLIASRRWVVVVGAVGQPRGAGPAAHYCLLDEARNEVSFERVPYDIEGAAKKIEAAGLPPVLAKRLREGQ